MNVVGHSSEMDGMFTIIMIVNTIVINHCQSYCPNGGLMNILISQDESGELGYWFLVHRDYAMDQWWPGGRVVARQPVDAGLNPAGSKNFYDLLSITDRSIDLHLLCVSHKYV